MYAVLESKIRGSGQTSITLEKWQYHAFVDLISKPVYPISHLVASICSPTEIRLFVFIEQDISKKVTNTQKTVLRIVYNLFNDNTFTSTIILLNTGSLGSIYIINSSDYNDKFVLAKYEGLPGVHYIPDPNGKELKIKEKDQVYFHIVAEINKIIKSVK